MSNEEVPERIPISHDEFYAEYIGRTRDGRQFFLTTPFCIGGPDFVALYLFNADGDLLEARIDQLGPRDARCPPGNMKLHDAHDLQLIAAKLAELGDVSFESIEVKPFTIQRNGIAFGLMVRDTQDEDEGWSVTAEPGNYMAFGPPWDGEYYT